MDFPNRLFFITSMQCVSDFKNDFVVVVAVVVVVVVVLVLVI